MTRGKILSFLSEHFACKFQVALLQSRNLINGAITREEFRSCASNCKSRGIENTSDTSNYLIIANRGINVSAKLYITYMQNECGIGRHNYTKSQKQTAPLLSYTEKKLLRDHNRECVFFARGKSGSGDASFAVIFCSIILSNCRIIRDRVSSSWVFDCGWIFPERGDISRRVSTSTSIVRNQSCLSRENEQKINRGTTSHPES